MRSSVRGVRAKFVLAAVAATAGLVVACNTLLDFDSFKVAGTGDGGLDAGGSEGGGGDAGCINPTGFGGRGCFRCTPTTNAELLNACTSATFEPFDNQARIAGFDPTTPRPPLVDGGATPPPFDAGAPAPPSDAGPAPTAPACDLKLPNPVMVLGATGFPMETIAKAMASAAPNASATIFYLEKGSCLGVASRILNDPKLSGEIVYFDSNENGAAKKCTLQEPHPADISLSALFAESCAGQSNLPPNVSLPAGVEDFLGPVNPVMFATPATSVERVISAEAAYMVYGFGFASGVAPWTDENYIFRRTAGSGNQQSTARTLKLPPDALRGRDSGGSSNMKRALQASDSPNKTLGISSSEIVDVNRDVMKSLAYQHYNQHVGFYPDSDPGAFDRRNVRDGHYFMSIPLHVLVRTDAGDPVAAANTVLDPDGSRKASRDKAVKTLAFVMVNRQEPPVKSVDLFGALKKVGNVPQCAMRVSRAKEGDDLQPFKPSARCDCAFEAASPGVTLAECKACSDSTTCPADRPTCSFGYCE